MHPVQAPTETAVTPDSAAGTTPVTRSSYSPGAPVEATPAAPLATTAPVATRPGVSTMGYRIIQLVWLIVGVVDLILALDFVFRAVGANNTGFAHDIYRIAGRLAAPFDGIFNFAATKGTPVLRWSDVLAVVIYTAAAWIVVRLVRIVTTRATVVRTV